MRKSNIVICDVKTPFVYGGASILTEGLINALSKAGNNVEVISLPFFWEPHQELIGNSLLWRLLDLKKYTYAPIDLVVSLKFPSYYVKAENKISWLMHQHRDIYDLYESNTTSFDKNSPEDLYIRNQIIGMDTIALNECKKNFTISKNVSERLKKFNNIESETLYHPPKLADSLHFNSTGDYFFVLSRLEVNKRIDLILKALSHTDKKVKVVIAGTGPQENNLKKLAVDLGVDDRVTFLGFITDEEVVYHYSRCKAVVFVPHDEDYGYITLEAFLSNKIVITTNDSGGPLEFISNQVNGYIVANDPFEIGAMINKVNMMSEKELEFMGAKAYSSVKNIGWDDVVAKLIHYCH